MMPKRTISSQIPASINLSTTTISKTNTAAISIKTSIYDWDSPSSFTGTVKRRPSSGTSSSPSTAASSPIATDSGKLISLQQYSHQQPLQNYPAALLPNRNNSNKPNSNTKRDAPPSTPNNHISPQEIVVQGNCQLNDERTKDEYRRILHATKRSGDSSQLLPGKQTPRGKPSKLRLPRSVDTIAKSSGRGLKCVSGSRQLTEQSSRSTPSRGLGCHTSISCLQDPTSPEFKELFCDFPPCYESTAIIGNHSIKSKPPPPYRDPPQPPPPQSSSHQPLMTSCENSEKQQTKFGIRQQKKGLIKTGSGRVSVKCAQPQQTLNQANPSSFAGQSRSSNEELNTKSHFISTATDRQKTSYKGRVSEIRNCISRINSKGLFSFPGSKCPEDGDVTIPANANEYIIYNPLNNKSKTEMEDDILSKPEFTSSLFKNIPVRPRKGGIPHMENYCLFDPSVDFINEKELKKTAETTMTMQTTTVPERIDLDISNNDDDLDEGSDEQETPVEEIIYNDNNERLENNYFTIEPEPEPSVSKLIDVTSTTSTMHDFSESPLVTVQKPIETLPSHKSNSLRTNRLMMVVPNDQFLRNRTMPIESNYVLFRPGPIPSRSLQFKAKKPRPLSALSHSDADSGFLSPVSPDELKFNPALVMLDHCDNIQQYIEIYTDWANYYLERVRSKKKVTDLSADCRDGLLLADVIEAVTSFKVPDLIKKPKTQQQMFDNVNSCLTVLRAHSVGGLDTITANDICTGRLKAVLALFFALSRYKQQTKQQLKSGTHQIKAETHHHPLPQQLPHQQQQHHHIPQQPVTQQQKHGTQPAQQASSATVQNQPNVQQQQQTSSEQQMATTRQIPAPYTKTNGSTAIPLPATVLVQRRCPPDKVRPLPPTPNHTPSIPGLAKTGELNTNGRPGSPPQNHISFASSQNQKGNNGLRQPQCKIPASPYHNTPQGNAAQQQQTNSNTTTTAPNVGTTKHSMLDKLKLFNKEKSTSSSNNNHNSNTTTSSSKSQVSKRTSSSSGFSSARSERSDSSLSLNDGHVSHIKPPATLGSNTLKSKDHAKGGKQSKLLGASQKATSRETLNAKVNVKHDKKDKSPCRKDLEQHQDTKIAQFANRNQKTNVKQDAGSLKSKQSSKSGSSSNKLETRSESKPNLVSPTAKPLMATAGTGIPKPMAAIKGTTKQTEKRIESSDEKSEKGSDISSSHHGSISEINQNQRMHIVNPVSVTDSFHNSPVHMNKLLQSNSFSMSDSLHSSSTHSGGGLHSNSSESSVIYRPSSESGSDIYYNTSRLPPPSMTSSNPIPNRKDNRIVNHNHHSNDDSNISTASNSKFHTVPSRTVGTIYEEEKPVNVVPMRPLLRGYNSHVTLPTRGARAHQHYVTDYCETDIGQGYCSDGDALRRSGHHARFYDIDNGYLSEGGGGVHGKHFLSVMRARSQLPTTIEERIRSSRGSLDSIGTAASDSSKMEMNGSPSRSQSHSRSSGRDNWNKMPEPINGHGQPLSPTSGRKDKSSPSHSRRSASSSSSSGAQSSSKQQSSSSSGRTKGVPQSFGYVKRSNGSATGTITATDQQNLILMNQQHHHHQQQQQQHHHQQHHQPQSSGGVRTASHVAVMQQQQQQQQHQQRSGKMKVSGGTQTCTSDLQTKVPSNTQHRSFSLTGPGATQLSQSIRERLSSGTHSLPKTGTEMHVFQHRISNRVSAAAGKILDGSLSDTQTYAEVKPEYNTYAMWLKHSNTASSRLSEGDSMESLQIGSPGMTRHGHKLLHRGSAGGGGGSGSESPYIQSPRLNRSNSIRSTKSEKMYPSMLNRGQDIEIEPYYCLPVGTVQAGSNGHHHPGPGGGGGGVVAVPWSQPTSPTPPNRGFAGPLSPTHVMPGNMPGCHRLTYPKKNDEVHGSAASLLSGGSSLYGSAEERQANEVRRLKRELCDARDQVMSLSSQLSTNAHVVAAFEQSLSNMTQRLQQLTATAERKDSELTDMRQTIELLRKQSIQAGLTTAHMQSMGVQTNCQTDALMHPATGTEPKHKPPQKITANGGITSGSANNTAGMQRHHSSDSMCSLNSISSGCSAQDKKKKKGWLRSSFTKAFSRNAKISKTSRHMSSTQSGLEQQQQHNHQNHHQHQHQHHQNSSQLPSGNVSSLPPPSPTKSPQKILPIIENAKPLDAIENQNNPIVEDLKKQLREKDLVLTDIRLEALSSASQLESLKDTVMKMRQEMMTLKQNNERLQKLVTSRSLAGSEASLGNAVSPNGSIGECRRYSLADGGSRPPMELPKSLEEEVEEENIPPAPAPEPPPPPLSPTSHIDLTPPPPAIEVPSPTSHLASAAAVEEVTDHTDGKKLSIAVYLGQPESFPKYAEEILESDNFYCSNKVPGEDDVVGPDGDFEDDLKRFPNPTLNEFVIAYTYISGKTTWQNLDYIVRKTFKDYVSKVDPGTNLGLNTDSITSYHLGEAKRGPEMGFPELLPCGYIVGNVRTLYICLQGVGCLAFDSLIPRSIVHRYISLLTEHRRLILCGPSGTGKSYLARKLAEFLVARSGRGNLSEAIATFNVDHKSSKELRQYLGHIAEQASMSNGASELPSVIILDNLHHASALGDVFSSLLSSGPVAKLPCIIGTMSQATCNTTNLQLHHNFRWVLTANHMEPVKGFLGRFLRRRLFQLELSTHMQQGELNSVLAWLPTVWQHINRFLENHSSSDVTIGPRLFLSCPLDLKESQVWFTDIWNYHLAPYLVEAVREGVQLYGRRGGAWNDPSTFIRDTYPWPYGPDSVPPLRQLNAEDVGLEADAPGTNDSQDPLLNMLMRLQEAANYSENQEQESDCASLDSNITPDSSAGAE